MASRLMLSEGRVQKSREGVVHLMASRIIDRTDLLDHLSNTDCAPVGPTALSRHHRNVRIVPRSRAFHCSTSCSCERRSPGLHTLQSVTLGPCFRRRTSTG